MNSSYNPSETKFLTWMIIFFACLGYIQTGVYSASLSHMASSLNSSTNHMQMSISAFMFGMSFSQLFYGPISDSIGRKKPLLFGFILIVIGCFVSINAQNGYMLILGTFLQGLGSGASALFRTVIRDSFSGVDLIKISSYASVAVVLVVPASPLLGGFIQEFFGWQGNFIFILVYTILMITIIIVSFKETKVFTSNSSNALKNFKAVFSHKVFMYYSTCLAITFGVIYAWVTASPILLIHLLDLTATQFGWASFIISAIPMIIGVLFNNMLVEKYGIQRMLKCSWVVMMIGGLLMLLGYFIFGFNLLVILVPLIFTYLGASAIMPNIYTKAFSPFSHIAGYAAAVYGFMQIIGGAIFSSIMAYIPENNQLPLSIVITICPVICYIFYTKVLVPIEENQKV